MSTKKVTQTKVNKKVSKHKKANAKKKRRPLPHVTTEGILHAKELAKAFKSAARYPYRATATLTGYPLLRPFDTVIVNGVPETDLHGIWVILNVKHVFNGNAATAYSCVVELGTNKKLLAIPVQLPATDIDEKPGPEDTNLSEEEFLESLDEDSLLDLDSGYFDVEEEITLDEWPMPQIFSQEDEPRLPSLGEVWWNPATSELHVGYNRSWVEIGTGIGIASGTSTGAFQVVIDLEAGNVLVDDSSALRVAVLGSEAPTIDLRYPDKTFHCVSGSLGASWGSEGSTWSVQTDGTWSAVESIPAHFGIAEAALLGLELIDSEGWLVTPRGVEVTEEAFNDDPYELEVPDFAAADDGIYWLPAED